MDTRILGQAAMSAMPQLPTRRVLSAPWLSRAVRHVTHHAIPALASVVLAIAFLHAHMTREAHPQAAGGGNDWFAWNDQGLYLRAAHAWLSGNLDPAQHHYMPGYPLLAVPFMVHVPMLGLPLPDPFLPADLASLIGSLWLVASIARLLAPELRHARALGALAFLAAMLAAPQALDVWIVPWSTSPAAALTLLCLWAALRFHAAPHRARWSFLAGLAGTGLLGFRPTDTSVVLVPSVLLIGWALLSQRAILLDWLRAGLAGLAGATLSCVLLAAAYLPVWGAGLSPYLAGSMRTGFEWRLLPLRWVTLMLDPRPLLQDGHGLIWAFPWLVVGLSAAVALITMPNRSGRAAHAAVGGAMLAHVMLYLCYRDLHPSGLWVYWNHHYFKWVVPVASLYCVLWLASVLNARPPRWGLLGLGLVLLAALLPWRAGMHRDGQTEAPHWDATGRLVIPGGLPALRDGVVFPAPNSSAALAPGHVRLSSAKATYEFYNDYKTLQVAGGIMLVPLRPLSPQPLTLELTPAPTAADLTTAPLRVHQDVIFGLPCWLIPHSDRCAPDEVLPPAAMALGTTLGFGDPAQAILRSGWSDAEPAGRWSLGDNARLHFGVSRPALEGRALVLDFLANPFLPAQDSVMRIHVIANGHAVADWAPHSETPATLRAVVPAAFLGADGVVSLDLELDGASKPVSYPPYPQDFRTLGLFVRSLTLRAGEPASAAH